MTRADFVQGVVSWQEVAAQIWTLTHETRNAMHGPHSLCPSRIVPYGPNDPDARRLHPACSAAGCLDHVHEVLALTITRMHHADLSDVRDLPRYINRVVHHEVVELKRRDRVAVGFPAKPSRSDGVPGKVIAAIAARYPGVQGEWLITLFRIMRSYPFTEGRAAVAWPIDGFTAEKCRVDGGVRAMGSSESRAEIRHDITLVLQIATEIAGRPWVYETILSPLMCYLTPTALPDQLAV